ncbi:MAG: AmmeMemoRadiSam system protein B [Treponema sp.]|jgi:AmmeMemoRadiSam system protein B|nr:AmmeMemoRadiSam system protein B [Treponema sp.]
MNLRASTLPPGWYPRTKGEIAAFVDRALASDHPRPAVAAAAPHAGWYYSGALAARAVNALAQGEEPETVAVLGGHLPRGARALFFMEDAVETPLGALEIDRELRRPLLDALGGGDDRYADNTVEVLLPLVRYLFPRSKVLALRLPADRSSFEAGRSVYRAARDLGRSVRVLASTDLTHYGPNYGFSPRGSGRNALDWVTDVNDRRFIDAVTAGDYAGALHLAETEKSACSAGAVLGAMGFAAAGRSVTNGGKSAPAELLAYANSAGNGEIPDSFVGYGAFAWYQD